MCFFCPSANKLSATVGIVHRTNTECMTDLIYTTDLQCKQKQKVLPYATHKGGRIHCRGICINTSGYIYTCTFHSTAKHLEFLVPLWWHYLKMDQSKFVHLHPTKNADLVFRKKDYFENHFNVTEVKTGLGGGTKHPEIKGTDTWLDTGQDATFIWIQQTEVLLSPTSQHKGK